MKLSELIAQSGHDFEVGPYSQAPAAAVPAPAPAIPQNLDEACAAMDAGHDPFTGGPGIDQGAAAALANKAYDGTERRVLRVLGYPGTLGSYPPKQAKDEFPADNPDLADLIYKAWQRSRNSMVAK